MENQEVENEIKQLKERVADVESRLTRMERLNEIVKGPIDFIYKFLTFMGAIAKKDMKKIEEEFEREVKEIEAMKEIRKKE
jgi:c-di-GMP-related signal transduction protein